ncbi:MAG: hypothetical protein R3E34_14155 [Rhodocyclaceae bacterium]
MTIQSVIANPAATWLNSSSSLARTVVSAETAGVAANLAQRVSISPAARGLLAAESAQSASSGGGATAVFDTTRGAVDLDIDAYFTPPGSADRGTYTLPPLLLPSQNNIDALRRHISAAMPEFLARNGIPFGPSSMTYDSAGKVQLPADYPYTDEFTAALEGNPAMARELQTVNALTSTLVELRKSLPFVQEYAAASPAEAGAVVARYSQLFSGSRTYDTIALGFSADGRLSLTANGEPVFQGALAHVRS